MTRGVPSYCVYKVSVCRLYMALPAMIIIIPKSQSMYRIKYKVWPFTSSTSHAWSSRVHVFVTLTVFSRFAVSQHARQAPRRQKANCCQVDANLVPRRDLINPALRRVATWKQAWSPDRLAEQQWVEMVLIFHRQTPPGFVGLSCNVFNLPTHFQSYLHTGV